MNKKLLLLLGCLLVAVQFGFGQARKVRSEPLIWTEIEADYILPNKSFFYFRNQYRHNTDPGFPGIKESGALSKFYQAYVLLGYEHRFSDHWVSGLSGRYTFDADNDNKMLQFYLQHTGKIGSVNFLKRLTYDYMKPEFGDSRGRTRLRAGLEKDFTVGKSLLRPHISYELFLYNDFQKDNETLIEERTVDRTRLRLAVSYKVSSFLWLTPYFTKQTDYFNVLATYTGEFDADGNPIVKDEGGKLNRIDPIIGLDIRFILGDNAASPSPGTLK